MAEDRSRRRTRLLVGAALAMALTATTYVVPAQAQDRAPRDNITISSDKEFNPANGVRSGTGTKRDPYVISGWQTNSVTIRDTSAHILIRNNDIGRLVLNWNGPGVTVVDNDIDDLRVNQNVKRTGAATGGRIANNRFGIVGQLRHFDGVFENNTVRGDPSAWSGLLSDNKAVQFDGFHGSRFRNNTIHGWVEVRLHGHHHGSSFDSDSHHHAEGAHEGYDMAEVDHTKRYHQVWVTGNRIYAEGPYALLYTDTAHSANDRTAASEENPKLNQPHIHSTRIHLANNRLYGAGLTVNVFNAKDERHTGTNTGVVDIRNNQISLVRDVQDNLWSIKDGIRIQSARDAIVKISGNKIKGEPPADRDLLDEQSAYDSGIFLRDVDKAKVYLSDNSVSDLLYGIKAAHMTKEVHWWISGLDTSGVEQSVYWDNTVANPPRRRS